MLSKVFSCAYYKGTVCGLTNDSSGPDGFFNGTASAPCRAKKCSRYLCPTKAKEITPIYKIEIAHTPLSVRSLGANCVYYTYSGSAPTWSESERSYPASGSEAVTSLISEWYSYSYPPMLRLGPNYKWAEVVSGWFLPTHATGSQNYVFSIAGNGYLELQFNSVTILATGISWSNPSFITATGNSIPTGTWVPIVIRYYSKGGQSGFTILWENNDSLEPIPLSAGVLCRTSDPRVSGVMPLAWQQLRSITNPKYDESDKQASQLSFTVPLARIGDSLGYKYSEANKRYDCLETNFTSLYLKGENLVRYSEGFRVSGYNDYAVRFVGNIKSLQTKLAPKSGKELEITALDFLSFASDTLFLNYPWFNDYWNVNLIGVSGQSGNTDITIQAYDRLPFDKVVKSLLIRSGVDPTLFYSKRKLPDRNYTEVSANYLVEPTNSIPNNWLAFRLECSAKYGTPVQGSEQDPYIYTFSFGEKLLDTLNKIADNYGYTFGFNSYWNEGAFYLQAGNNPTEYKLASGFTNIATWVQHSGIQAIGANYWETQTSGTYCSVVCTGTRFDLIFVAGTGYGSPTVSNLNVRVVRNSDSAVIVNKNLSTYHTAPQWFYWGLVQDGDQGGLDLSLGYNPCARIIASGLAYEGHTITISSLSFTYKTGVNAILIYARDAVTPTYTYQSTDSGYTPGHIKSMDLDDNNASMRNDWVILGRRMVEFDPGEKDISTMSKHSYVQSRAMDVDSLYNPNAINFRGKEQQAFVIEPKIASLQLADYIAYQLLDRSRLPGKMVGLEAIGNPLIEKDDCLLISEGARGTISGSRWVKGFSRSFSKQGFINTFDTTFLPPWPSYLKAPAIDLSKYNNNRVVNFSITPHGGESKLTVKDVELTDTTINVASTSGIYLIQRQHPTPTGPYCHAVLWGGSHAEWIVVTGYDATHLYVLRGRRATYACTHPKTSAVEWRWDPFLAFEEGEFQPVKIEFDVLTSSWVKVEVISQNGYVVSILTGDFSKENPWSEAGIGHKIFFWQGIDSFGDWNQSQGEQAIGYQIDYKEIHGRFGKNCMVSEGSFRIRVTVKDQETLQSFEYYNPSNLNILTRRPPLNPWYKTEGTGTPYPVSFSTSPLGNFGIDPHNENNGNTFTVGADGTGIVFTFRSDYPFHLSDNDNTPDIYDAPRYYRVQIVGDLERWVKYRIRGHELEQPQVFVGYYTGYNFFTPPAGYTEETYFDLYTQPLNYNWQLTQPPFNFIFKTLPYTIGDIIPPYDDGFWRIAWGFRMTMRFIDRTGRYYERGRIVSYQPMGGSFNAESFYTTWRGNVSSDAVNSDKYMLGSYLRAWWYLA